MDDHFNSIYINKTQSTKTLRWPINLAVGKSLTCIACSFLVCLFFSCSHRKSYSRGKADLRQKQKGRGVRGQGSLPSSLAPSPIAFFPHFSFRVAETLTLPRLHKQKKTHQKTTSYAGQKNISHVVNDMPPKHYFVNDPHHR